MDHLDDISQLVQFLVLALIRAHQYEHHFFEHFCIDVVKEERIQGVPQLLQQVHVSLILLLKTLQPLCKLMLVLTVYLLHYLRYLLLSFKDRQLFNYSFKLLKVNIAFRDLAFRGNDLVDDLFDSVGCQHLRILIGLLLLNALSEFVFVNGLNHLLRHLSPLEVFVEHLLEVVLLIDVADHLITLLIDLWFERVLDHLVLHLLVELSLKR